MEDRFVSFFYRKIAVGYLCNYINAYLKFDL